MPCRAAQVPCPFSVMRRNTGPTLPIGSITQLEAGTLMRNRIFSGASSEAIAGYAKAVIDGRISTFRALLDAIQSQTSFPRIQPSRHEMPCRRSTIPFARRDRAWPMLWLAASSLRTPRRHRPSYRFLVRSSATSDQQAPFSSARFLRPVPGSRLRSPRPDPTR